MAIDEELADRVRERMGAAAAFTEQQMFGGLALMVDGNLTVGVIGDELIARVGPEDAETALHRPGTRPFDMTGRPMRGWVVVGPEGTRDDDDLDMWIEEALSFVRTLPPK